MTICGPRPSLAAPRRLAVASGHDSTLRLLETVIEVDEAGTGTARLKRYIDRADEMALATGSTKTLRVGPPGSEHVKPL